ncbi:hypothetical protein BDV18DRAFT_130902 [Aspergillus unguis]
MFTRGRPYLKRCGLLATLVDHQASRVPHPQPDEPFLLFLYPRWFSSDVKQQRRSLSGLRRVAVSNSNREHPARGRPRRSPTLKSSFEPPPRSVRSEDGTRRLEQLLNTSSKTTTASRADTADTGETNAGKASRLLEEDEDAEADADKETRPDLAVSFSEHLQNSFSRTPDDGRRRRRKRLYLRQSPQFPPSRREPLPAVPNQDILSQDLVELSKRHSHPQPHNNPLGWTIHKWARDALARAETQAKADRSFVTPAYYKTGVFEEQRREILVPDETIALFAGVSAEFAGAENIWFERVRYGCRVHVLPNSESVGRNRKVVLWGSLRATELVASKFLDAQERQKMADPLISIQTPCVPIFPSRLALSKSKQSIPLVRGVWDPVERLPARYDAVIPKMESISTVREFAEYVEQLTTCLPQEDSTGPHNKRVVRALGDLFTDQRKEHLFSTAALNVAVAYLLKERLHSIVLWLVNCAKHVATTDTFNMLLKGLVKRTNLGPFPPVVLAMGHLGIRPDVNTWLTYAMSLPSPNARIQSIKVLRKKGLLRTRNEKRAMLQVMIRDLFKAHLLSHKSVDEFFHKTAMSAGLNWFPPSILKQMFSVTAELADEAAMKRLYALCQENRLPLTSPIINDIIHFYPDDTFTAVHYALRCLNTPTANFEDHLYARLFVNAFENKHYNICRVLWRYACMSESVTKPMRNTMTFLLPQNTSPQAQTERDRLWWTCAGKVIAGVSFHLPEYPLKHDLLSTIPPKFHHNPILALVSSDHVNGKDRAKQLFMARALVKHDYQIGPWYRPVYPLAHMLEAAAELDREWEGKLRPVNWLMHNAIRVPVELVGHNLGTV